MPQEWLPQLRDEAHRLGLAFISSPFHEEAVEFLEPFVDAYKIASYELTHSPLARAIAATGKPVILSTGASTLSEVREAVDEPRVTTIGDLHARLAQPFGVRSSFLPQRIELGGQHIGRR